VLLSPKPCVLIVDPVHPLLIDEMKGEFAVHFELSPEPLRFRELLMDADALILRSGVHLGRDEFDAAHRLRFVGRAGVGLDNIDLVCAKEHEIAVFNVPDLSATSVAEHTFALLLAVARKITLADRQMRENLWCKPDLIGTELHGKTIGIIGLGRIGDCVAKIATAFGMRAIASVQRLDEERIQRLVSGDIVLESTERLICEADVISLNCPLTHDMRNLISAAEFAAMKPTAFVINMARGGVVDEKALYNALVTNRIAGAASDVFAHEKEATPLVQLDNFVATPHIGAMTDDAQRRIAKALLGDLRRGFRGQPIVNRVV
jgi:D-3-phosphoglycerate dehydrogenase / 2-oxoglutarate reductase